MQTAQLNIKIDPKLKKQAEKIAAALGFSVSSILKAFLLEFTRTKKVSFSLEEKNDPFGDGITGKEIEEGEIRYNGFSKERAKKHGKAYDGMIKSIKEGTLTEW